LVIIWGIIIVVEIVEVSRPEMVEVGVPVSMSEIVVGSIVVKIVVVGVSVYTPGSES
jgi:hypothetical protein